jgi:hypothetical protein
MKFDTQQILNWELCVWLILRNLTCDLFEIEQCLIPHVCGRTQFDKECLADKITSHLLSMLV